MEQIFLSFLLLPLFLSACFFTFVIPGLFLLHLLKIKEKSYILASAVGISLFLLLIYSFSWIQLHYIPLVLLILINLYYFIKQRKKGSLTFGIDDKVTYFIVAVGSLLFVGLTWFSGLEINGSTYFYWLNAEDGLVHISRIYNLLYTFPPTHPALSGIPFNGYHYFYDLLLSRFVMFFHFSPFDLYFRYFSLFIAIFYGTSFMYLAGKLTQDVVKIRVVLLFAYFATGFGIYFQIYQPEYSSDVAQPLRFIFDPSVMLSLSLLLIFFAQLTHLKKSIKYAVVVGVILGVLSQLKVYTGLIGIFVLVCYSTYLLVREGRKTISSILVANGTAAILTIATFFPNNIGAGTLLFEPLRFYGNHIQQDFFTILQWENRRLTYTQKNYYLLVVVLHIIAIAVFWISALGIKVLVFLRIKTIINKNFWKDDFNFILFAAIAFSILMPSLFLQSIVPFDIGQFFWISLSLMSIPAGIVMVNMLKKTPRFMYIILVFFTISFVTQAIYEYNLTYSRVKTFYKVLPQEKRVYNHVSLKTKEHESITVLPRLILNDDKEYILNPYPSSLVAAMTGRSTYFENEKIDYPLEDIYKTRTNNLFAMHNALKTCDQNAFTESLGKTGSPYLVTLFDSPCLATHSGLLMIERSEGAVFYLLQEKKM